MALVGQDCYYFYASICTKVCHGKSDARVFVNLAVLPFSFAYLSTVCTRNLLWRSHLSRILIERQKIATYPPIVLASSRSVILTGGSAASISVGGSVQVPSIREQRDAKMCFYSNKNPFAHLRQGKIFF